MNVCIIHFLCIHGEHEPRKSTSEINVLGIRARFKFTLKCYQALAETSNKRELLVKDTMVAKVTTTNMMALGNSIIPSKKILLTIEGIRA